MSYVCRVCDATFLEIPADAKLICPSRRDRFSALWLFADGNYHDLRKRRDVERPVIQVEEKPPQPEPPVPEPPVPPPVEQVELLREVVEVLVELPQPEPEIEIEVEPEETEVERTTTVAAAFHRILKNLRSSLCFHLFRK